ncbi:pilin, partial [bacterium]|nr:pilin [bacterium]
MPYRFLNIFFLFIVFFVSGYSTAFATHQTTEFCFTRLLGGSPVNESQCYSTSSECRSAQASCESSGNCTVGQDCHQGTVQVNLEFKFCPVKDANGINTWESFPKNEPCPPQEESFKKCDNPLGSGYPDLVVLVGDDCPTVEPIVPEEKPELPGSSEPTSKPLEIVIEEKPPQVSQASSSVVEEVFTDSGAGLSCPDREALYCDLTQFVLMIERGIDFLIFSIAVPLAAIAFTVAGFFYMASQGNPSRIKTAHDIFFYAILGIVIALAAWLIIRAITGTLVKEEYTIIGTEGVQTNPAQPPVEAGPPDVTLPPPPFDPSI